MTNISTGAETVRWDLGLMYLSINDPQIDADVATLVEIAKRFNVLYKGRLSSTLGQAISDRSEIEMLNNKVSGYLFLLQSLNVAEPAVKSKIAEIDKTLSREFGDNLTFFQIELVALGESILDNLYSDPVVARHPPLI